MIVLYIILMHISCFMFLADLLFLFISTMEIMLEKKQIQEIFLLKFAETTHNNTFGPGAAYKCTVQWWLKKFCRLDKSLKINIVAAHGKLRITN